MHRSPNVFGLLAERAESGDVAAQHELLGELEPEMIFIVRRVVQRGVGWSSMDRRILAEAGRIGLDAEAAAGADGEHLICKVARCVSALFVDRLGARSSEGCRVHDTICN